MSPRSSTSPAIENIQIISIQGQNRQHENADDSTITSNTMNTQSSSKASQLAKLSAGALAWTAVKVIRTTAVAIFGLGVGVGLILGDSLRTQSDHGRGEYTSYTVNVVGGGSKCTTC